MPADSRAGAQHICWAMLQASMERGLLAAIVNFNKGVRCSNFVDALQVRAQASRCMPPAGVTV